MYSPPASGLGLSLMRVRPELEGSSSTVPLQVERLSRVLVRLEALAGDLIGTDDPPRMRKFCCDVAPTRAKRQSPVLIAVTATLGTAAARPGRVRVRVSPSRSAWSSARRGSGRPSERSCRRPSQDRRVAQAPDASGPPNRPSLASIRKHPTRPVWWSSCRNPGYCCPVCLRTLCRWPPSGR